MSFRGQLNETPKGCRGCCFRQTGSGTSLCGYSLYMGDLRNCPVEECPYYCSQSRGKLLRKEKLEKRKSGENMYDMNIEADWVGHEPDEYEEREEYIPEYYPECECDYE